MKRIILMTLILAGFIFAETLFEVKDSSNHTVLDVSTDGLRVMNYPDTLMVISSSAIRANIRDGQKGLSRSFSVTTSSTKEKGLANALEVGTGYTKMGSTEGRYTDFSPKNMFLGLNAGKMISNGIGNVFIGNDAGSSGSGIMFSTFIGPNAGKYTTSGASNTFIGNTSGSNNISGGFNTYIGWGSGTNNNGDNNVCVGPLSGWNPGSTTASDNIFIGVATGGTVSGNNNIILGNGIGNNESVGSNCILLGQTASGNNKLAIGNLLSGDFSTNSFTVNGSTALSSTLQIKGGTIMGKTQAGSLTVGTNPSAGYKAVTLTYPSSFSTAPKIVVTPRSENGINDVYAVTVRDVGTSSCVVIICRVDSGIYTWGQNLKVDWVAWEQ